MRKNIRYLSVFLLIGIFLSWPIHSLYMRLDQPREEKQLADLDQIAQELLTNVKKGDLEGAKERIERLAVRFPNQHLPIPIRIETLNAVTQSILAAKQSIHSPSVNEEQILWHATRVRVAIDALRENHQPMWRSYYPSFMTQVQNLQLSAVERDFETFRVQFEENQRLFLALKPAMSIQLDEAKMQTISSAYEQILKEMRKGEKDWQIVRETLRVLNSELQDAFVGGEKSAFTRLMMRPDSPLVITTSISVAVIIALAYVAYRKYDAEFHST